MAHTTRLNAPDTSLPLFPPTLCLRLPVSVSVPPSVTHTHIHTHHTQRDLESIRSHLLQQKGALINLTGDDRALSAAAAHVNDLLARLPGTAAANGSSSSGSWQQQGLLPRINEALVVPTQVGVCVGGGCLGGPEL